MDWVLEHLQLIIFIAGTIAWWLNQRARQKAGESADYDGDGTPEAPAQGEFTDPDLADRTRKIREEIQRKIEERRRAAGGYREAPPDPAPVRPAAPVVLPPVISAPAASQFTVEESRRKAEILQQQADWESRLAQARELKEATQKRVAFETQLSAEKIRSKQRHAALVEDLHHPDTLRRAVVLREVLGPPLALRR